ncbi:MAG: hypothetical protein J2P31_13245, partial [Blastocatellia bacterium]|nr:hypothetical protein [Blastocatellia bacterium]
NAVDVTSPLGIGRGQSVIGMDENQPSLRIHEWNLTIEKQISANNVIRFTYNGKHGINADSTIQINPAPSNFIYYAETKQPLPTGPFASVALHVYDQNAYTSVLVFQKKGYINSSTWTAQFERRFTKGLGFQAFYTMTNALRFAGNATRDDVANVYSPSIYLPGTVPTDQDQLNRLLFYNRDTDIPKHRIRWNWNYDLPFGKGQKFLGSSGGFLNSLIGGWKLSGAGTILSTWYALPTNNWGEMGKFEIYNKKYKIEDCRATPVNATQKSQELCTPGYLYFNGYISPQVINRTNAAGIRTGVFGIPANYQPAQKPINAYPNLDPAATPANPVYDTNNVRITLNNGTSVVVGYDTGYHPWRNQFRLGPWNWEMDSSLLKVFTIKEKYRLRVNFDLFNVFNVQGLNPPNSEGIASLGSSYNPPTVFGFKPRQLQGTLRFEW